MGGQTSVMSTQLEREGLSAPNKKKEVKLLYNEEKVSVIGLLETKIKSW